jgi:hypothetical protein
VRAWGLSSLLVALALSTLGNRVQSQERGPLESYGTDGRLFSPGMIDYFLLTRQPYATEDSSGYEGDVRAVKKFVNGGYEIILKHYGARCNAPFDNMVQIIWSDPGDDNNYIYVDIKNPTKFPGEDKKESYNLYWAACYGQFQKFK